MRLGRDFSIASLRADGFRAIFLGIGLPRGRKLPIPGADLPNVYDGLDFLRSFNEGTPMPLGRRIVVIGGGNVAYDVARAAIRPGDLDDREDVDAEIERGEKTAYDVARSVLRMSGDKQVHVVCLEQRAGDAGRPARDRRGRGGRHRAAQRLGAALGRGRAGQARGQGHRAPGGEVHARCSTTAGSSTRSSSRRR